MGPVTRTTPHPQDEAPSGHTSHGQPTCAGTARQWQPDADGRPTPAPDKRCNNRPVRLWRYRSGPVAFCANCEPFEGTPDSGWLP